MMHPFAEGNIVAAQRDARRCVAAIRAAIRANDEDTWRLLGHALSCATNVEAQLDHAMELEEMAVTTGEEVSV